MYDQAATSWKRLHSNALQCAGVDLTFTMF